MGLVPSHSLLLTLLLLLLNPHCAHPEYITSSEVNLVAQGTHEFIMHTVPETNMTFLHSVTVEWKTLGACTGLGMGVVVACRDYAVTKVFPDEDADISLVLQWDVGAVDAIVVTVSNLTCAAAVHIISNMYPVRESDDIVLHSGLVDADTDILVAYSPSARFIESMEFEMQGICTKQTFVTITVMMTEPPGTYRSIVFKGSDPVLVSIRKVMDPDRVGGFLQFNYSSNCPEVQCKVNVVCKGMVPSVTPIPSFHVHTPEPPAPSFAPFSSGSENPVDASLCVLAAFCSVAAGFAAFWFYGETLKKRMHAELEEGDSVSARGDV